ncbi:MAG: hypothetical protein Ct9H300mP16_15530 [Pseudomonadota bacterium]|nr:MAG: hypothetical protein Ct9H300mP16_15530 [Pseudomonadota bacterium]
MSKPATMQSAAVSSWMMGDGVAVLPTAPVARRNGDVEYLFRPGSDFHYLTGFGEPEAVECSHRDGRRVNTSSSAASAMRKRNLARRRAGLEGAVTPLRR